MSLHFHRVYNKQNFKHFIKSKSEGAKWDLIASERVKGINQIDDDEDELELVSWMDAGGRRAKGKGGDTGRRRRARRTRPKAEQATAGHGPAEARSAGAAMAGTGAPGGGGATTMLSSPGYPRVPVEVVGTRGAMGQEEQADVVDELAVAAPSAVERVVGCGERGGGGSWAACTGGRRFG